MSLTPDEILLLATDHGGVLAALLCVVALVMLISLAKVFAKAGKPAWAAIVPVYSAVVLFQIAGRPAWWVALLFVPVVGLGALLLAMVDVARRFGRSPAYGVGLACFTLVFLPALAFGSSTYSAQAR